MPFLCTTHKWERRRHAKNAKLLHFSMLGLFLCAVWFAPFFSCCLWCRSWRHTYIRILIFVSLYIFFSCCCNCISLFTVTAAGAARSTDRTWILVYSQFFVCRHSCHHHRKRVRSLSTTALMAACEWVFERFLSTQNVPCRSYLLGLQPHSLTNMRCDVFSLRLLVFSSVYVRIVPPTLLLYLLFYHYSMLLLSWFVTSVRRINAQPLARRQTDTSTYTFTCTLNGCVCVQLFIRKF